jgi:hypothetical protein
MFVHKHQNWNCDWKSKTETFAIHIFQLEPNQNWAANKKAITFAVLLTRGKS